MCSQTLEEPGPPLKANTTGRRFAAGLPRRAGLSVTLRGVRHVADHEDLGLGFEPVRLAVLHLLPAQHQPAGRRRVIQSGRQGVAPVDEVVADLGRRGSGPEALRLSGWVIRGFSHAQSLLAWIA